MNTVVSGRQRAAGTETERGLRTGLRIQRKNAKRETSEQNSYRTQPNVLRGVEGTIRGIIRRGDSSRHVGHNSTPSATASQALLGVVGTHSRPRMHVHPLFSTLSSPAQPCAAVPHEAFRKRRACRTRPHMYVRAAGALSCEARVWRHRGARARDACVPPSVGVTEPTPPRGATPMSRSRLMPPGHRTARGGHTPERDVGPAGLPRSALQSRPMRG